MTEGVTMNKSDNRFQVETNRQKERWKQERPRLALTLSNNASRAGDGEYWRELYNNHVLCSALARTKSHEIRCTTTSGKLIENMVFSL